MEQTMKGRSRRAAPCAESYALEKILKQVSDIVSLLEDAQKVMNELVRLTTRLLKVGNCSLVLVEPGTNALRIHASYGLHPKIARTWRARIGEGISGWVAQTGKPLLIKNVETHPLFRRKSLRRYNTKSLLSVPLIHQKRVLGVLNVNNRNDAGVFTQSDELLLSTLANFIVIAIEKSWMRERLVEAERQEADLRVARKIQEQVLPAKLLTRERWEFAARNLPARWIAGDFFDAISLADDRTCVVVGDVCGKGVPAALYMARVMAYCRVVSQVRRTAGGILAFVNDLLASEWTDRTFVTALACVFDNRSGRITFCSAGHPMPFRLRESTGEVSVVKAGHGLPLGIESGSAFEDVDIEAQSGDAFVLYTDGITEAKNTSGELFHEKRLQEVLRGHQGRPEALAASILTAVQTFAGREPQSDDLTLVAIKHT
jgi:sigma-B regulation protein RsbU (phosphoserine phosphatase)